MDVADPIRTARAPGQAVAAPVRDRRLGAILFEQGKLEADDIARVLEVQNTEGTRFGEAALRLGLIGLEDLYHAIAVQYGLPHLLPDNARVSNELVVAFAPLHRRAEEMRMLRGQLLVRRARGEMRGRALALLSSARGEGRSFFAANLAVAFAQLGERTLLVDADLRRPRQHRIFDVDDRAGLSAVLGGRADTDAVIALPEFGPLFLLPAGARPPNPVELLSGKVLPALLQRLEREFDVMLFDTPAADGRADAQAVALVCGNALVLARRDHAPLAALDRLLQSLAAAGVVPLGTVFNGG